MMRKQVRLFVISLFIIGSLSAQSVSLSEASRAAGNFLLSNQKSGCQLARVVTEGTDTLLYVFNSENSYVVIGGDKRVPPVLAFSDHQLYNDADVILPVKMWLDNYQQQLRQLKQQPVTQDMHAGWRHLTEDMSSFKGTSEVLPLMKSHWGQGTYYSYYCPRDYDGENNRVVTGCVATAMAQLIYYYRFPETGIGSYSYLDSTYGVQSADYGNTTYDFSAMCDDPTSVNLAISTLMYHCGVGVDMVYGPDGSGMYNHSAARVLRTFFKYSPETQYVFRDSTDLDWDSLIVSHLHRNMPLYYAGWSNPNINGHGFICDGYKMVGSNYYYHFNFGWDGSADGYFYTNGLNLSGTNFNLAQELIINAYPDTTLYEYPVAQPLTGTKVLTSVAGSFTDGTQAYEPYRPNMDYIWIIRPQEDFITSISFKINYDIAAGDTLMVSFNTPAIAPVTITDSVGTLTDTWDCTEITVRLLTDDSLAASGIRASYNAVAEPFCHGQSVKTSATGTIEDGSGSDAYRPFSTCKYRIIVPAYNLIQLHFDYLDLEEGYDFLRVFDNNFLDDALLATLTGSMSDTTLTFYVPRLALMFETDEHNNADGFKLTYRAGHVGVDDISKEQVSIFPNPAESVLFVNSDMPVEHVSVYDLAGRVVLQFPAADNHLEVPLDGLTQGVYIIRINTSDNQIVKKIIKK